MTKVKLLPAPIRSVSGFDPETWRALDDAAEREGFGRNHRSEVLRELAILFIATPGLLKGAAEVAAPKTVDDDWGYQRQG